MCTDCRCCAFGKYLLKIHPISHIVRVIFILFGRDQPRCHQFFPRSFEGHVVAFAFLVPSTELVVDIYLLNTAYVGHAMKQRPSLSAAYDHISNAFQKQFGIFI